MPTRNPTAHLGTPGESFRIIFEAERGILLRGSFESFSGDDIE